MFSSPTVTDPTPKSLGNINATDLNSNQQIVPVAYLAGRRFIAGNQLTPIFNVVTKKTQSATIKGGKGGSSASVTYIDYGTFGLAFCTGGRQPVEAVFKIIVNSDIVWESDAGVWFGAAEYVDITVENFGVARIYKGSFTQPIDSLLTPRGAIPTTTGFDRRQPQTWPYRDPDLVAGETTYLGLPSGETNPIAGQYDPHSAYRPLCYGIFGASGSGWRLGRNPSPAPNIKIELHRSVPWFAGSAADRNATGLNASASGVNPIGVIYDLLTDPVTGLRYTDADLFQAGWETALTVHTWLKIAPLIDNFSPAKTLLANLISPWSTDVKSYVDGFLRERDGQLDIGVYDHGPIDTNALPLLTDDDLDGDPQLQPTSYNDVQTTFYISYSDKDHFYQRRPQKYGDPSARTQVGRKRNDVAQQEWIVDGDVAKQWITEAGRIRTLPGQSGPIPVKREWLDNAPKVGGGTYGQVREGDRLLWESASVGITQLLWIQETEWPEDKSGQVTLHVENERGFWPSLYIPPADTSLGNFLIKPVAIATARVIELPNVELKTSVNTEVAILALRTDAGMLGFHVHLGLDTTSFVLVSERNHFAVFGKIKSAAYIAGTANPDISTGMVVDLYGPDLDQLTPQSDQQRDNHEWIAICNNEFMGVGNVVALGAGRYRIYFRRGIYDTILATHAIDSDVWFIPRANLIAIENANFVPGATRYFKLQPFTQKEPLDLADATPIAHIFPALPADLLAPFALKVSRLYRNDLGGGVFEAHVVFTWDWALEQDVSGGFDINWRAGGLSGLTGAFTANHVAAAGVTIYDPSGVAQVKRQSCDLNVGTSNLNYEIYVRAIDGSDVPGTYSIALSRRTIASSTTDPTTLEFTARADLEGYDVTGLTVGRVATVTIGDSTHFRQLQSGAPTGSDWSVLAQTGMRWRITGGRY